MTLWTRLIAPVGAGLLLAACGATPAISLADKALMPDVVMMQSVKVQEAYRFASGLSRKPGNDPLLLWLQRVGPPQQPRLLPDARKQSGQPDLR